MQPSEIYDLIRTFTNAIDDKRALSHSSTVAYINRMRKLVSLTDGELKDSKVVIKKVNEFSSKANIRKDLFSTILAIAKRSSKFHSYIGTKAIDEYTKAFKEELTKSKDDVVVKTASHEIPSMDSIRAALPKIKDRFGETSLTYITCLLQASIKGLRNDLGGVHVRSTDGPDSGKWYNRRSGRIFISNFKTSRTFPPYNIVLDKAFRVAVNTYLDAKDSKYLVSKNEDGPRQVVEKGFRAVGMKVGVSTIRQSMISELLMLKPYNKVWENEVAAMFKHSPDTMRGYYRPTGSSDEDE